MKLLIIFVCILAYGVHDSTEIFFNARFLAILKSHVENENSNSFTTSAPTTTTTTTTAATTTITTTTIKTLNCAPYCARDSSWKYKLTRCGRRNLKLCIICRISLKCGRKPVSPL